MAEIIKREQNTITINDDAINEVAKRISKNFDIPVDKASAITKIGVANAIVLNRFRGIFDELQETEI